MFRKSIKKRKSTPPVYDVIGNAIPFSSVVYPNFTGRPPLTKLRTCVSDLLGYKLKSTDHGHAFMCTYNVPYLYCPRIS